MMHEGSFRRNVPLFNAITMLLLLLGVSSQVRAQVTTPESSVNFGSVAVGASTGSTHNLSFTVPSGITLGSVSAVTQGAPNLDFTVVAGGTCANGTTATTCTVPAQFLPTAPGRRLGAVVLTDQGGNTLITVPVYGTGTGPLVAFGPGLTTTVAGSGPVFSQGEGFSGDGGPATNAELFGPEGITMTATRDLYIADTYNQRIRRVDAVTGVITTVAGIGPMANSLGVIVGSYSGDGGPATGAALNYPQAVVVDASGNLYIGDSFNDRIRMVSAATGVITTVAGNGNRGYGGDGSAATSAELNIPAGLAVDPAGNLYIADSSNNRIRMVSAATGVITTVAGNGNRGYSGDGSAATSAELAAPYGIALDAAGNLYIADTDNCRIRKVSAETGTITTVAGIEGALYVCGVPSYGGDGGVATSAELRFPAGVAVDAAGNLYIGDRGNNRVRKVDAATGLITTVAGGGNFCCASLDEGTPATIGGFGVDQGVAVDAGGNLYIADTAMDRISEIPASDVLLSFPQTSSGYASAVQKVTVSNPGNAPLSMSAITVSPNFAIDTARTKCSTSEPLAPGNSCVIGVAFRPTTTGNITGTLTITDNAMNMSGAMQQVSLAGTTDVIATISPSSLAFSSGVDIASAAQQVVLTNNAASPLAIYGFSFRGNPYTSQFSEENACPAVLAAGASCSIDIIFKPTFAAPISKIGLLNVNVVFPANSPSIALSGTVVPPAYSVSPTILSFASQMKGTVSAPQTVTITNTSPVANLKINSVVTEGPFAKELIAGPNSCGSFPATLTAGTSCTISIASKPTVTGVQKGVLKVNVASPGTSSSVVLSGTGVVPITVTPYKALEFEKVSLGLTKSIALTVINPANNPDLTGLAIRFDGSSDFSRSSANPGTCDTTLAGGATAQSCTINVVFAPGTGETNGAVDTGIITVSGSQGPVSQSKTVLLTGTAN
jgi:sugar lactone lactonase YvrE